MAVFLTVTSNTPGLAGNKVKVSITFIQDGLTAPGPGGNTTSLTHLGNGVYELQVESDFYTDPGGQQFLDVGDDTTLAATIDAALDQVTSTAIVGDPPTGSPGSLGPLGGSSGYADGVYFFRLEAANALFPEYIKRRYA